MDFASRTAARPMSQCTETGYIRLTFINPK